MARAASKVRSSEPQNALGIAVLCHTCFFASVENLVEKRLEIRRFEDFLVDKSPLVFRFVLLRSRPVAFWARLLRPSAGFSTGAFLTPTAVSGFSTGSRPDTSLRHGWAPLSPRRDSIWTLEQVGAASSVRDGRSADPMGLTNAPCRDDPSIRPLDCGEDATIHSVR